MSIPKLYAGRYSKNLRGPFLPLLDLGPPGPKSNKDLDICIFEIIYTLNVYIEFVTFEHYKNCDCKNRRPLDFYCIFLCKISVLTYLRMVYVMVETCGIYVRETK